MKKGSNNYRGLNTDTGYDSIKDFYIDALDIRITTDRGESMGSITNIKGNKKFFELPIEAETQGVPEVIGATSIRNLVILLVADDSNLNGWLYTLSYTDNNQAFISLDLIYFSSEFRFSKEHPIEAVGRYESPDVQRIYWTDYNNYLRSLNIKNPNIQNNPVGLIDIFPDIKYTLPKLTNVLGGGILKVGQYQYAYRLVTNDGKKTLISPPSNLIHCVDSNETLTQSAKYSGDPVGTTTNKAHEIYIDTAGYSNFEEIELLVIFKESLSAPIEVFSVTTQLINNVDGNTFIHTGVENTLVSIETFEFLSKQYPFKTAKTITPKDNSLVVANIKEGQFSVQDILEELDESFDAKTKRFDRTGNEDNTLGGNTPEEIALNKAFNTNYNKDAHWDVDWHVNQQYKYQNDGETLGGQGPNISYKFHLEPNIIDGDQQPGFVNSPNSPINGVNLNDGNGGFVNTTFDDMGSPFKSGLIRGYKRGEVYRFGIIFYNKKGEASFVEYIGDIKFPDLGDEDKENNVSGTNYFPISRETERVAGGNITTGYSLGIEFDIDFSTCPQFLDRIESYQIVRLERQEIDSKRLCSGIFRVAALYNFKDDGDLDLPLKGPGGSEDILHLFQYLNKSWVQSGREWGYNGNFYTINSASSFTKPHIEGGFCTFYSPDVSYEYLDTINKILKEDSLLLMTGRYGQYYGDGSYNIPPRSFYNFPNNTYFDTQSFRRKTTRDFTGQNFGHVSDLRRKLRTTGKVDKKTAINTTLNFPSGGSYNINYAEYERGVEYIRKWETNTHVKYDQNSPSERELFLGPYQGEDADKNSKSYYFRNFYADPESNDLNSPGIDILGDDDTRSKFSKGASGITGSIMPVDIDPLDSTNTLNKISEVSCFQSGPYYENLVTSIPDSIGPLNGSETEENLTSTPLFDILLPKTEIYGGFTQDALENNTFIPASPIIHKQFTNPKVFGGDIFISMFEFQMSAMHFDPLFHAYGGSGEEDAYVHQIIENTNFPVESRINLNLAYGSTTSREVKYTESGLTETEFRQETGNIFTNYGKTLNMYEEAYNLAYSFENDNLSFFVKPVSQLAFESKLNDIRAYISNVKFNNEEIDSWTQFPINNFHDVDDYGPINKILTFNDNVYFFQDKAIGMYAINTRVALPTGDGIPIEIGQGKGLQDHKYISNSLGSIHQWGVRRTQIGIYAWDSINSKINFIGAQGIESISEVRGLHSLLKKMDGDVRLRKENGGDNPILGKGAHITQDIVNNEIFFTFLSTNEEDKNMTLVYDEVAQQFSSKYSATPNIYIENGNLLLSSNPNNKKELYQHNVGNWGEFYGNTTEASITLVLNADAPINKILRFIEFNSIVRDDNKVIDRTQTITGFKVENEYQTTDKITFDSGRIKHKFDKWRLKIPRDQNNGNIHRLRSTYFKLTLYFDNTYNKELILNRILYYYDIQVF